MIDIFFFNMLPIQFFYISRYLEEQGKNSQVIFLLVILLMKISSLILPSPGRTEPRHVSTGPSLAGSGAGGDLPHREILIK